MLPENIVTLFILLAFHAWLENKKGQYILWASLLVLTKESGLVLPAALCLWDFISFIRYRKLSFFTQIKKRFFSAVPFFFAIVFFIVQRKQMGWFFFPRHIGFIDLSFHAIKSKLWTAIFGQLFVFNGGIFLTISFVLAAAFLIIKKINIPAIQKRSLFVILLFSGCFIIFSSLNYYSPRYILCLYPLLFLCAAFFITEAFTRFTVYIPASLILCLAIVQSWYTFNFKTILDSDLGYVDAVTTQKQAIHWCLENGYREKEIFAQHQLERGMTSDAAGFIDKDEIFLHISNQILPQTKLFIFTCSEHDPSEDEARKLHLKTVAKFEIGKGWTEICVREETGKQ
ncbi:hypothetical protein BH09BAC5_BH09BAC5_23000 [soil metagenome]